MKLGCGLLKLSKYGGGSLLFHRFPVHSMDSSLIQRKQICAVCKVMFEDKNVQRNVHSGQKKR